MSPEGFACRNFSGIRQLQQVDAPDSDTIMGQAANRPERGCEQTALAGASLSVLIVPAHYSQGHVDASLS